MKLILHIGMPKAGSTALQHTLRAAAPELLSHGICYPADNGLPKNHNMLVCGFLQTETLPRLFRQIYGDDTRRMRRDFKAFLAALRKRVEASKAHTIILSGEMLFRKIGVRKRDTLQKIFEPIADEITIVAYVRSPAKFYMSQVQQVLKASHMIIAPKPTAYRVPLKAWEMLAETIRVIPYEREQFHGQDIARDFLYRFFPDLGDILQPHHMQASNQTISAEGIDILHKYRLHNHAEDKGRFTPDTGAVLKLISEVEAEIGPCTRPVAHQHLADYLAQASKDLIWLRERHGITFNDIDYNTIREGLAPPPPPQEIADICPLDPALRDKLMMRIMSRLTLQTTGEREIRFKTAMWKFR